MKLTEQALKDLGYEVVPFVLPEETWEKGRNFLIGMLSNGAAPNMLKDFLKEGEALLKPMAGNASILLSGCIKRFFIDTFLKLSNRGRMLKMLQFARIMSPEKFEVFLKERYIFCYEFA